MTNNKLNYKEASFKKECKVINLKYEYSNYRGNDKFVIAVLDACNDIISRLWR